MKANRHAVFLGAALLLLALVAQTRADDKPAKPAEGDGKAVEFKGVLRTGVVAIGGETTGTTISASGKTYELDFRKNPKLRALANTLNKKVVVVQGTLRRRRGIEIRERWIITVTDLRPAEAQKDSGDEPPPSAASKKAEPIRKLAVNVDPMVASQWSAKPGVTLVSDQKELAKAFGEAVAKQIAGQVDFAKEKLVHVAWGSSGPPFGRLQHEIKEGEEGEAITFFVKQPKGSVRGQAYRLGNDFFVVPKKSQVSFGGRR